MKKLLIILALVAFLASCIVINPEYTDRRARVIQPSYVYISSGWSGWYGWYNPYRLYGYYSQYNPYYWGWYGYQTKGKTSNTKTTITKRQLQTGKTRSVSNTTRKVVHRGSNSSARKGTTATRSTITRSGSSNSKATSKSSSGTRVKKK